MSEPALLSGINSPSYHPVLFRFTGPVSSNSTWSDDAQDCRLIFYLYDLIIGILLLGAL